MLMSLACFLLRPGRGRSQSKIFHPTALLTCTFDMLNGTALMSPYARLSGLSAWPLT